MENIKDPSKNNTNLNYIEINELPSKGITYPNNYKISYRKYTFGELLNINSVNLDRKKEIEYILEGIETSFPKEDLLYADFIYISILRKLGLENKLNVKYICPKCNKISNAIVDLKDMISNQIDVDKLPINIDCGDLHLEFSPLTVKDILYIHSNGFEKDTVSYIACYIKNQKFTKAKNIINNSEVIDELLPGIIDEIDNIFNFGPRYFNAVCENIVENEKGEKIPCLYESRQSVNNPYIMVSPFRGTKNSIRDRILSNNK